MKKSSSPEPVTKTGFNNLDNILFGGFRQGLYLINGVPSVGKTTFSLQIADNIAKKKNICFFSFGTRKKEIFAKRMSRISKERQEAGKTKKAFSTTDILDNYEVEEDVKNLTVFDYLDTLDNNVGGYSSIVVIDSFHEFMEIVGNVSASDKQNMSYTITKLKYLSQKYSSTVIVTSSFKHEVPFFFLSTADVVFDMSRDKEEKTILSVIKNRNGCTGSVVFDFLPKYNIFKESCFVVLD